MRNVLTCFNDALVLSHSLMIARKHEGHWSVMEYIEAVAPLYFIFLCISLCISRSESSQGITVNPGGLNCLLSGRDKT